MVQSPSRLSLNYGFDSSSISVCYKYTVSEPVKKLTRDVIAEYKAKTPISMFETSDNANCMIRIIEREDCYGEINSNGLSSSKGRVK